MYNHTQWLKLGWSS